jgi:HlyD family secretion protein
MVQRPLAQEDQIARPEAGDRMLRDQLLELQRERDVLLRSRVPMITDSHVAVDVGRRERELELRLRNVEPSQSRVERRPRPPAIDARREPEVRDTIEAKRAAPAQAHMVALAQSTAGAAARLPAAVLRNVAASLAPASETDHDVALRQLWRCGLAFIVVFGGALGIWAAATTVSSAVIAPGQFVVDGSVKKVQHPTGGIVGQLLVREGDQVAQGDLLIRLDETVTRANLQVVVRQLLELASRKARLEAERDELNEISHPPEIAAQLSDPEVARIVAAEQRLFEARRGARDSQRAQLSKRVGQLQNEIVGLRSQLNANAHERQIIAEELKGVRELFAKQLTPIMRLNGLERQAVSLHGQTGQLTSSIAQTEGKIAEIELQIVQTGEDLRAAIQKELRETDGKFAELSERRVTAEDQLKRIELRAPIAGTVHQLAVHTVGGVITPAEPAMLIVPTQEELILEAKVPPQDRDLLQPGQTAVVRVRTSNQRNTPELNGTLARVAADVSKEASATAPTYTVWVNIPREEMKRLGSVSISAGMQADVFIEIGSRSPLNYLLRPLSDQVSRAFRER